MNWVLILTLVSGIRGASVTVVPFKFVSAEACRAAGDAWARTIDPNSTSTRFVCVTTSG